MPSIASAVNKTESVFDTLILPGLSLAAGYFGGNAIFQPLADRIASFNIDVASTTAVESLDNLFGDGIGGARVITGLIVAVAGFSVIKMGGFLRHIGLFLFGAAMSLLVQGFFPPA